MQTLQDKADLDLLPALASNPLLWLRSSTGDRQHSSAGDKGASS